MFIFFPVFIIFASLRSAAKIRSASACKFPIGKFQNNLKCSKFGSPRKVFVAEPTQAIENNLKHSMFHCVIVSFKKVFDLILINHSMLPKQLGLFKFQMFQQLALKFSSKHRIKMKSNSCTVDFLFHLKSKSFLDKRTG